MAAKSVEQILDGIDTTITELEQYIVDGTAAVDAKGIVVQQAVQDRDQTAEELAKAERNLSKLKNVANMP